MKVSSTLVRALALALALAVCGSAFAQSYPSRSTRLIVSFPPGGPADLLGRFIAQKLTESFGQQVVVDNRPGANSIIAAELTAKAAPDGYTLLMAIDGAMVMNPALYTKLPYDPQKDFAPIAPMVRIPMVVMVSTDLGVNDLKSLVALSRTRPGKFNYGSAGPTTFGGMATEWLMRTSGADFTGVTYGGRGILQGLVAGDLQLVFGGLAAATPTLQTGKAKVIAVTSAQRMTKLPDIPTVAEVYPGFEVVPFYGFVAPAGTPPDIIARLNTAIGESIAAITPKLLDMGNEPLRMSPAEFKAFLARDLATWNKIVETVK